MKSALRIITFAAVVTASISLLGCGGGGSPQPLSGVDVNTLDGATGVPVNSNFVYTFAQPIQQSTVSGSTYFILPTPPTAPASSVKAELNEAICDSTNALDATVNCSSSTSCTLDPAADLAYGTGYTICLNTGIQYSSGAAFEGFMAQFTTETSTTSEQVTLESVKLVRLDGTELDLSARPIPRKVSIKYVVSRALTDEADRTAFESAITLNDDQSNAVAGTYAWSTDYTSTVFTPTGKLEYRTDYTIEVGTLPSVDVTSAVDTSALSFTTLTHRDVNGDGYADMIMGSISYSTSKGRAYVFLGSASGFSGTASASTADAIVTGTNDGEQLGGAVYIGGDVNGDGYEDVIVGAYLWDGTTTYGRAYIYHGGPSFSGTLSPDTTLTGASSSDGYFGWSISAGDVNGDGMDDVIVGARDEKFSGIGTGATYIFHGATGGIADHDLWDGDTADARLKGVADGDAFGISVSTAGDVNGDGYDDVIVGATAADSDFGNAFIFHGSASGVGDCDLAGSNCYDTKIKGAASGNDLGQQVSEAGDINGDGYDDILVGAFEAGPPTDRGRAYVLLGSASGVANCDLSGACTPRATITAADNADWLGEALHGGGDVNGDGVDDIIISAHAAEGGGTNRGEAYVFHGGSSLSGSSLTPSNADATVSGASDGDMLGFNVFITGDVNGDGYDDVLVSAPEATSSTGVVYFFEGSGSGIGDCTLSGGDCFDASFTGENTGDYFGMLRTVLY